MGKKSQQLKEAAKRLPKKKQESLTRFWGRILKKAMLVMLFSFYLLAGSISTLMWGKTVLFRSLTMEQTLLRLDHYRERYKFFDAVFLFDVQESERAVEIINTLQPLAPVIEPVFYFQLSKRYEEIGDMDKATFWNLLGSFRLRLDARRCEGVDDLDAVEFYTDLYGSRNVAVYVSQDIDRTERIFNDVMAWDAENPPQTSPQYFCRLARMYVYRHLPKYTGKPVDQKLWPLIYQAYREQIKQGFIPELRTTMAVQAARQNGGEEKENGVEAPPIDALPMEESLPVEAPVEEAPVETPLVQEEDAAP
ncbi:MAG: hypothetical protein EP349_05500 [Alphaproteobacteria bacterium]|nr:MAG: hypothetical protein EP349_05500 [Alphaproteobacteria bacterium]